MYSRHLTQDNPFDLLGVARSSFGFGATELGRSIVGHVAQGFYRLLNATTWDQNRRNEAGLSYRLEE